MITDFNNPNRPVIIGLDHGYGNMKTAHTCFQAENDETSKREPRSRRSNYNETGGKPQ